MKLPCYDYALTILSYNPKSIAMMTKTLLAKGYDLTEVERTISKLESQSYLDDAAFCKAYFQSEVINKGKSINAIKKKMYEKGIPKEIVVETLDELAEDIDDILIVNLAKEIRSLHTKGHDIIKIYEKLARKGHRYDDIKGALQYMNDNRGELVRMGKSRGDR